MPKYLQFRLPDVGEGLTEADIVEWKVAVGDPVTVNQVIVEIETAKSLVELPCPHAGVVSEILVASGQTVQVGSPIVAIDTDPDGPPATEPGAGTNDAPAAAAEGAPDAGAAATDPEANQDPDANQAGPGPEPDRDVEEESQGSGDVLVGYGTKPAPARRRRRKEAAAALQAPGPLQAPEAGPVTGEPAPAAPGGPAQSRPAVLAKPPVRKLAQDLGVDLARVPGTGPGGIITREDVQATVAQEDTATLTRYPGDDQPWLDGGTVAKDGRQTRVPVRSVRRRTAEAMVTSAFTAPHVTVFSTVDVTRTMKLVNRLREDRDFADVRITPLLIAAKALLLAIHRNPAISAAWDEQNQEIVYKHYVNLGIAAATPRGLVVPNIKDAHRMDLHELAGAIGELTATARAGKTTPSAMSDGTVTITNVGVFGIDTGTPILNPGESAILAFGAIAERPWVHKGKVKARWVTQLALSFDHRLVDGELGSRVLADVARVMEDPTQALVWG